MNAEKCLQHFRKKFGNCLIGSRLEIVAHNLKNKNFKKRIWLKVNRESFREIVGELCVIQKYPHFAVTAGYDLGETVELCYIFSLDYGMPMSEYSFVVKVALQKDSLEIPTITDLIPGALISEREIQEMLGVKVKGIPDPRRLFLDESFPKGKYPWRRDGKGIEKLVRDMSKEGKR